ncbi:MAG: aspartate/glutamate racemase family protein [Marinilabiliales bacterium]|nr:aspartate/glutamate racemase family protein [Marinilabiliales bacterium]
MSVRGGPSVWTVPRAVGDTTGGASSALSPWPAPPPTPCSNSPPCPSACSTRAWAVSRCSTSAWCALPGEHFAYVGDTARFPYGEKSRDELELFSRQITAFLETVPGQAHRRRLLLGHLGGAAGAAGAASRRRSSAWSCQGRGPPCRRSRYRRIGVLATEATVASGAYPRAIHSLDAGAEVIEQACPGLVDFIEAGDVASQRLADAVRGFTAPLKEKRPDVVIMGCTHYPLDRADAAALSGARRHPRQPRRRDRPRGRGDAGAPGARASGTTRMGSYRFYATGDVERFRADRRALPADAAHARPRSAARAARRASPRHDQPVSRARGGLRRRSTPRSRSPPA